MGSHAHQSIEGTPSTLTSKGKYFDHISNETIKMKDLDKSAACSLPKCMSLFFHLAFAIPLAAQLFSLVKEAANPTELKTSMSKESLSSFEAFPLLGRICVKPGLDVAKLTSYGYADPS